MSSDSPIKPLDGFAALAFGLVMFLMVLPVEADIVFALCATKHEGLAAAFALGCLVLVLVPIRLSWLRQRAAPEVWRGRGYLTSAIALLTLNLIGKGLLIGWVIFRVGR